MGIIEITESLGIAFAAGAVVVILLFAVIFFSNGGKQDPFL